MESCSVKTFTEDVKEGAKVYRYTWEVDTSLPRCRVEGSEYKFNSHLVKKELILDNYHRKD